MKILMLSVFLIALFGCKNKSERPEPDFYKNLYTNEILGKTEFEKLVLELHSNDIDSTKEKPQVTIHFMQLIYSNDSIIQPFKYDVRIGDEYIVRANSYEKIGMQIPPRTFFDINGNSIQIGGKQNKPMLINLWFVGCGGCVAEMPALNRLKEKYAEKVDFISLTFETKDQVQKFLKRKEFNFTHIASAEELIKEIGSKPYPENIFISKEGEIRYIEGGLSHNVELDVAIKHFESLLENLLNEYHTEDLIGSIQE